MTSLWLAWRTTKRYRVRAALAVTGVAVIGALLFDMLLLSRGLLDSFADLLRAGGFDVRVVADEGIPFARAPIAGSARLAADLRALPEIGEVVLIRIARGRAQVDGQPPAGVTLIGTSGTSGTSASGWTIVKGEHLPDPAAASDGCSVVISRRLAAELDTGPGSRIRISVRPEGVRSALPATSCVVRGVANFTFAPTNEYAIATAMGTLQDALGSAQSPEADLVLVASRPEAGSAAAVRAIERIRPDLRAYSNDDVVAQFNQNGFAYFRQISFVLSSLTMVFAFLLVATLLTVSVNQRLGEIAALRALGIGRARIASLLLWESALLVGGGALLALPLGGILAVALDRLLREMPGLPERLHFFVFQWRAVALHVALFAVTAAAAAAYPVWLTSRLPIAATLRREVVG
jgi:putative ABC transport system permease protein